MLSARALIALALLPIAAGVVFTHRVTPALTQRSHRLLRGEPYRAIKLKKGASNVTIEYQQGAYEWYMIDVQLGTPPQTFRVDFDTGSSWFWVAGDDCRVDTGIPCPPEPQPGYHLKTFNESASSTLQKSDQEEEVDYGAGGGSGVMATDVFGLDGIRIKNMSFILIDTLFSNNFFEYSPEDGMMGVGWPQLSDVPTPLQQMLPLLDQPVFTFALSSHQTKKAGTGTGVVTFGAVDKQNCAKNFNFVPMNDDDSGFWKIVVDGFTFGSYKKTKRMGALLDTGNPGMELPDRLVDKIAKAAKAEFDSDQQLYLVDCNAKFPDLVLTIGGVKYPIPSDELILDIGYKPGKCVLNLQDGTGDGDGPFTLGDPFYRTFCTAFDLGGKRLGFSKSTI